MNFSKQLGDKNGSMDKPALSAKVINSQRK